MYVSECIHIHASASGGQKNTSEPLKLELRVSKSPCGWWELSSSLLQEPQVLLWQPSSLSSPRTALTIFTALTYGEEGCTRVLAYPRRSEDSLQE